jgi:hypothetical protein
MLEIAGGPHPELEVRPRSSERAELGFLKPREKRTDNADQTPANRPIGVARVSQKGGPKGRLARISGSFRQLYRARNRPADLAGLIGRRGPGVEHSGFHC